MKVNPICVSWIHITVGLVLSALVAPITAQAQFGNTATGSSALFSNKGNYNTADGYQSLLSNSTGSYNSAVGFWSLYSNLTGVCNSAMGFGALGTNSSGNYNTATGYDSLFHNTTGLSNTANGYNSLYTNTTGASNVALGNAALYGNTNGSSNTASGYKALYTNNTGSENTAYGTTALFSNTGGTYNVADGVGALVVNTVGNSNTAVGYFALQHNTNGSDNIALGSAAGGDITTGDFNIDIGNYGTASDEGTIRIGSAGNQTAAYIAGVSGETSSGGVAVYINSSGKLGTLTSSRRFKFDIQDLGSRSDRLMNLRPVMFRYKEAAEDGTHPVQYGLIAEEVAKVYPDLVQYDKQGKPFTVYYNLLTPIMLNDLQKIHRQIATQQSELASQQSELASLQSTAHNQAGALQSQTSAIHSLQHAFSLMLALAALALFGIACVFYLFTIRTRRATGSQTGFAAVCPL